MNNKVNLTVLVQIKQTSMLKTVCLHLLLQQSCFLDCELLRLLHCPLVGLAVGVRVADGASDAVSQVGRLATLRERMLGLRWEIRRNSQLGWQHTDNRHHKVTLAVNVQNALVACCGMGRLNSGIVCFEDCTDIHISVHGLAQIQRILLVALKVIGVVVDGAGETHHILIFEVVNKSVGWLANGVKGHSQSHPIVPGHGLGM